ncbi:MAG: hypothetical protein IK096_06585 [Lachnospiraceae bacterium]|nr:hypothetical protein [Lachnospiraceae bacterium]
MKKLTQGKLLITLLIALAMMLISGLGIAGVIRDQSKKLDEEKATLTTERDRLKKIEDSRADYQDQTKRFSDACEEITAHYPADITQNNQLLFLKGIEDEFGLRIASASYTEPEAIYRFQYLAPGNNESYSLVRSTVQFPIRLSYDEWKRFIAYIEETDGCDVIETVMADYDMTESLVDADVTICQYAIRGDDRQNDDMTTEVDTGTDNIFSSNARLSTGEENPDDEGSSPLVPHLDAGLLPVTAESDETQDGSELTEGEDLTGEDGTEPSDETGEEGDTEADGTEEEGVTQEADAGKSSGPSGIRNSIRTR